jgi:hypothetical protein
VKQARIDQSRTNGVKRHVADERALAEEETIGSQMPVSEKTPEDPVRKFRKLEVTTKPKVRMYADNAQMGRPQPSPPRRARRR